MSKLEIFVLKEDVHKAVEVLHNLGTLHIEQMRLNKIMEQRGISRIPLEPQREEEKSNCEILKNEVNELIQGLGPRVSSLREALVDTKDAFETKSNSELIDLLNQLKERLAHLHKEASLLKDELDILPRYKEILASFAFSKEEFKFPEDFACIALIFSRRYEREMQIFQKHLEEKIKTKLSVHLGYLDSKRVVALLFYPPKLAKQIDEEIFKKGTIKIELPKEYLSLPLKETINSIEKKISEIPIQLEKVRGSISNFAKENISMFFSIKAVVLDRLAKISVLNNFLQLRYTVDITGWLPKEELDSLKQALEKSLGKNFAMYERTRFIKHTHEIPVLLKNPKGIRPYELLLRLLPPPKYGTMDATGLVSLFFPIFFGLIVGDIGYGLIFLSLALFLKRSSRFFIHSLGSILFTSSLSSIFFGILYGEFFGNLGKDFFKLPHLLFNRHESIIPFLILALSVGVFHIVLGFILGIIRAIHRRHRKEEIEKIAILGGLIGLFLLVGSMIKILPSRFLPPSIVFLAIVTIILIILRGFLGPLEVISAVANIFSYARLMALGLAGVMMASIANHIGGLPENIFIGIILASLLHALNLVLSVFSPTIQSLRLQYVEFFSKFYEPGGKKYSPFRRKEVTECIS